MARFLRGHEFVTALQEADLLPEGTTSVTIRAEVSGAVTIDYTTFAGPELLEAANNFEGTDDEKEATVR